MLVFVPVFVLSVPAGRCSHRPLVGHPGQQWGPVPCKAHCKPRSRPVSSSSTYSTRQQQRHQQCWYHHSQWLVDPRQLHAAAAAPDGEAGHTRYGRSRVAHLCPNACCCSGWAACGLVPPWRRLCRSRPPSSHSLHHQHRQVMLVFISQKHRRQSRCLAAGQRMIARCTVWGCMLPWLCNSVCGCAVPQHMMC